VRLDRRYSNHFQFTASYALQNLNNVTVVNLNNYFQGYGPSLPVTIEVAQFIYLLLNNSKIRDVIDTITSKSRPHPRPFHTRTQDYTRRPSGSPPQPQLSADPIRFREAD